ncbi:alpha/beta hydrolase [Streptomyces sp. XM4193]|uniref:alpha/beta fold hydrolase n=1 Tax=Streptomyces sp. XM4193 TaxID=2929782 RepID=UPI001FF8A5C9|nr:alpha/beta fold hydrolase [Streptomyces sp. XM4193]MCK1795939.1 alpha/beta hydrolase [Streptomyces sp. XM4193]
MAAECGVNGATLHHEQYGPHEGPPVLLVHGHPFDHTLWEPQARALAGAGHRVIVPDLRGYGRSALPAGAERTHLSDFADDLVALLDRLGVSDAVVGGVSMGGQIAMDLAVRHPGRVRALVLSDTSPVAESQEGKAFRNRLADRLLAEGMDGFAQEVIDRMIAPYNVTDQPEVADHVLRMMRGTDPRAAAAALRGRAERPDYREGLAALEVPVLVVVGADDGYTPVADARALHELLRRASLTVIERAGHLPGLEQPDAFNAALLSFLDSVAPSGS